MPDSAHASFWDARYSAATTPWDADGVPAALRAFALTSPRPARILIPGCGSGHEAAYLLQQGWDVLAVDFSPVAIALAARELGERSYVLREADFFSLRDEPFDAIYERAFLCALPPRIWPAYAEQMALLTRPNSLLAGFFFLAETSSGPPYGTSDEALQALLGGAFRRVVDDPVSDSLPVFAGHERWQVWQRIDHGHPQAPPADQSERPDQCETSS